MMTAKVLQRAAELVEAGWCQHAGARRGGRPVRWNAVEVEQVCLTTAVARAVHDVTGRWPGEKEAQDGGGWEFAPTPELEAATRALLRVAPFIVKPRDDVRWNNAPGRTAEEVAALLRTAATRAEEATR